MYEGNTIGVVVVAYNEEGFVGDVIDTLPSFVDRAYVVDDASTDGTWDEIRRHAAEQNALGRTRHHATVSDQSGEATLGEAGPSAGSEGVAAGSEGVTADGVTTDGESDRWVVPIRHEENRGVGGAVKTGYRHAYADGIDVTVTMAGDGQMDPEECHRIVDPVATGKADYAKGNRLYEADLHEDMSSWRLFGNWTLTLLTKIASGYWQMMDPANGYTAISHRALDELDIDAIYEDYGSLHDVLVRLNVHDLSVADVPLPAVYEDESSGIAYSTFVPKLSALLLKDFLWRLRVKYVVRNFRPFVLFYAFGVVGGVAALLEVVRSFVDDDESAVRRTLAGLLLLVSGALVTFAMVFDMLDNQDLEYRPDE